MTNSEANVTSGPSGSESLVIRASAGEASASALAAWRTSFESSALLGFGHAVTLAAMSGVSPVCASFSLSSAQPRSTSPVRASVRLAGSFLPAPRHLAAVPSAEQSRLPLAAVRSAAVTFTRRFAATRQRCRKSERTPNHALQRTATVVTLAASAAAFPPTMQPARQPPPSLSCAVGERRRPEAASVTAGAVRCSAWLGDVRKVFKASMLFFGGEDATLAGVVAKVKCHIETAHLVV